MNCPYCNKPNRPGAKFCVGCGRALPQEAAPVSPPSPPPSQSSLPPAPYAGASASSPNIGLKALGLVGLIALVVLTVLAMTKPGAASTALPSGLPEPRAAGQRGLDYLLRTAVKWQQDNNCYGCHVQSFAVMGAGVSKKNEYNVNVASAQTLADYLVSIQSPEGFIMADSHAAFSPFVQTALAGIGLSQYDEFIATRYQAALIKMADWLVQQQQPDGHWPIDHVEAPVDQGEAMVTGGALMTIAAAERHESKPAYDQAIQKSVTYLRQVSRGTTQDLVFAIAGLKAAGFGDDDVDIKQLIDTLHTQQNGDGGWGETEALGSNGYATGQVLYVYKLTGVPIQDDSFLRGAVWLLQHQSSDGSWQQINSQQRRPDRSSNYATTMWAVIGLGAVFDIRTEQAFLSLIQPGRDRLQLLPVLLFYLIPAVIVLGLWRKRNPHAPRPLIRRGVKR